MLERGSVDAAGDRDLTRLASAVVSAAVVGGGGVFARAGLAVSLAVMLRG